jgi:hypothetical protein
MADEGYVQVATDGSGKRMANLTVALPVGTIVTDGSGNQTVLSSATTVFLEKVIIADTTGKAITDFTGNDRQKELIREIRELRRIMCEYTGQVFRNSDDLEDL